MKITLQERGSSRCNLVHKFIPMPQAIKIPKAKAVRMEKKLGKMPALQLTKVKIKKEVIQKVLREGKTFHFATLMDICHLKNSELEPQLKKKNTKAMWYSEVTLGSASTSRRRSISLHTSQNGRCTSSVQNSEVRMSRHLDTCTTTQVAKILVQYGRPQSFFLSEMSTVIHLQDSYEKGNSRKLCCNTSGNSSKLGMPVCESTKKIVLVCVRGRYQIGWKEREHWSYVEAIDEARWY